MLTWDAQGSQVTTLSGVGGNRGPSLCGSQHVRWSSAEEKNTEKFLPLGKVITRTARGWAEAKSRACQAGVQWLIGTGNTAKSGEAIPGLHPFVHALGSGMEQVESFIKEECSRWGSSARNSQVFSYCARPCLRTCGCAVCSRKEGWRCDPLCALWSFTHTPPPALYFLWATVVYIEIAEAKFTSQGSGSLRNSWGSSADVNRRTQRGFGALAGRCQSPGSPHSGPWSWPSISHLTVVIL